MVAGWWLNVLPKIHFFCKMHLVNDFHFERDQSVVMHHKHSPEGMIYEHMN